MQQVIDSIKSQAEQSLIPALRAAEDQTERAVLIKSFIKVEDRKIRDMHDAGAGGQRVAGARSAMLDAAIHAAFITTEERLSPKGKVKVAVTSVGGYGRGLLNPGSDIDLLFILPVNSTKIATLTKTLIQEILYLLWDTGFKVGHATRSISESIREAKAEQQSKTALMDTRYIAGNEAMVDKFITTFRRDCIQKNPEAFFELRRNDISSRHKKYSHTVFLQEPHVKESCGGLRDYQNIIWVANVERGTCNLEDLVKEKILTKGAYKELEAAYDFIHRVRNELHYHTGRSTDILTLQLQGVVATNFQYPEKSILRRCESFMRDYYRHTRAIFNHTNSLMEIFHIEIQENDKVSSWLKFIPKPQKKRSEHDGFVFRDGRIYPKHSDIFKNDSGRMMRVFQEAQRRNHTLAPIMRRLIKENISLVNEEFLFSKANRETFRAILERKGDVAHILRAMHKVQFLGKWMPEFGMLDCLVQHEFFHRYTADEHTLRCIDQLDALVEDQRPERSVYRDILMSFTDPYALYLALILHDTGRAENLREHTDGSAVMAARVCSRYKIKGARRSLMTFLVDHHLTFWKYATNKNLEDPEVIEEFAGIMKTTERLEALLLFTYADSNGTNEEAWSPWKESLMLQLYRSTRSFLTNGKNQYEAEQQEEMQKLKKVTKSILREKYHEQLDLHFERMPEQYFRYRAPESIAIHVRAVRRYLIKDEKAEPGFQSSDLRWINRDDRGYTELVVTTHNRPLLIEKVACALAASQINIIAANVYTRTDGITCDIFHVCTEDQLPVTNANTKKKVEDTFSELIQQEDYQPEKHLKKKRNFLQRDSSDGGIPFPVRAFVNNHASQQHTAIEVQALDRIGLLHDLFLEIGKSGLATVHARICTEKGAAVDTIYVNHLDGTKVTDQDEIQKLEYNIQKLVGFEHAE
ncbi:[protein-PII] uridylyltransferase [Rubritalea marina]|uniref:[protein-PII] uridylyltransferase n=1 Tax=Rubritalea marina TaxID=361055 RepID=UPI000364F02C|nr:[protein-PII] uridylyltransferase [Rubritalea marina]